MKKLLFALVGVVLLGAGCFGGKTVEGDWWLAFDLPNGWVMTQDYAVRNEDTDQFSLDVSREDAEVVLQSTDQPILFVNGEYSTNDFSRIRVLQLDQSRIIPRDAEDLGDGFFKEDMCATDEGENCGEYGQFRYYLETETAKYQFIVEHAGDTANETEDVILSAQPVTVE